MEVVSKFPTSINQMLKVEIFYASVFTKWNRVCKFKFYSFLSVKYISEQQSQTYSLEHQVAVAMHDLRIIIKKQGDHTCLVVRNDYLLNRLKSTCINQLLVRFFAYDDQDALGNH